MNNAPLEYTRNVLLENERAVIERDTGSRSAHGAERKASWGAHATVHCAFWWWHSESGRSVSRQFTDVERTVNRRGGGIAVPIGTDVLDTDRVARITNAEGETIVEGPFRIVSIETWEESHMELSLMEP